MKHLLYIPKVNVIPRSSLSAEFLVIKLIDYLGRKSELENLANPFSEVILAQLAALDSHDKPDEQRKNIKFSLTRRLYKKGYSKDEILNLHKFIDWLIGLPEDLEIEYRNEIYALVGELQVAYVTSIERLGIEKGMQQAGVVLEKLMQNIDIQIISQETGVSLKEIELLKKILVSA